MIDEKIEQIEIEDIGKSSSMRTLGAAFMAGAVLGMGMAKAASARQKPGWQKMLDKLDL